MIRDVLMPLSQRVRRPIAPRLSIDRAFAVSVIGSISIASWVSLAAVAFMAPLQALPLQTLFATYIGFVAGLTTLSLRPDRGDAALGFTARWGREAAQEKPAAARRRTAPAGDAFPDRACARWRCAAVVRQRPAAAPTTA